MFFSPETKVRRAHYAGKAKATIFNTALRVLEACNFRHGTSVNMVVIKNTIFIFPNLVDFMLNESFFLLNENDSLMQ